MEHTMAGGDINAWRRQNSDPIALVLALSDGTVLKGNMLLPRDKSLRDLFNLPDPFVDFECTINGEMVIAKSSIISLRKHSTPNADQLDKKLTSLDKADPHRILGVAKTATQDEVHAAYLALARAYHPDRFASANLPPEVADYFETMTRRINIAFSEIAPVKTQAKSAA
jgi:hypothetical protein